MGRSGAACLVRAVGEGGGGLGQLCVPVVGLVRVCRGVGGVVGVRGVGGGVEGGGRMPGQAAQGGEGAPHRGRHRVPVVHVLACLEVAGIHPDREVAVPRSIVGILVRVPDGRQLVAVLGLPVGRVVGGVVAQLGGGSPPLADRNLAECWVRNGGTGGVAGYARRDREGLRVQGGMTGGRGAAWRTGLVQLEAQQRQRILHLSNPQVLDNPTAPHGPQICCQTLASSMKSSV